MLLSCLEHKVKECINGVWRLIWKTRAINDYLITVTPYKRYLRSHALSREEHTSLWKLSNFSHTSIKPSESTTYIPQLIRGPSHCCERSNVGAGGVTSMMAGPYKIMLSMMVPLVIDFEMKT